MENKGYAKGGGEGAFTMTFKFAKVNGSIYCYADGRLIGSYSSTEAAGMFSDEAVLKASTYRGNADTDVLKFTVTLDKTFAIDGTVADTATEFGVTAAGNFTFTAAIQGTGLYTYAGIRIRSGENFIDFYSHTYSGNQNYVRFNGWNIAVNGEGKVNIADIGKAVYKVVKTDEKISLYINDTLIFEFDKNYQLASDWGNRFFTEGAVFSFGLYTEVGAGGTGYACDVNIDYAN